MATIEVRFVNTGVSGVGGRPVQLASEEAELEEEDDVDSMDCFRCRCVAAANSCLGVLGLCTVNGAGDCGGGGAAAALAARTGLASCGRVKGC